MYQGKYWHWLSRMFFINDHVDFGSMNHYKISEKLSFQVIGYGIFSQLF